MKSIVCICFTNRMWIWFFSQVWDGCTNEEQKRLLRGVTAFLSKDFQEEQKSFYYCYDLFRDNSSKTANAVQIILDAFLHCKSIPIFPDSTIRLIAEKFSPYHAAYLQEKVCKESGQSLSLMRDVMVYNRILFTNRLSQID